MYLTLELVLNIFHSSNNDSSYVTYFRHNALPMNLIELKEEDNVETILTRLNLIGSDVNALLNYDKEILFVR